MARLIISAKLTIEEAVEAMRGIEKFFRDNPTRKKCRTNTFSVKRGHVVEEVMKHTHFAAQTKI